MAQAYRPPARSRRFAVVAAIVTITCSVFPVLADTTVAQAAGPPPNTSIFFYSSSLGGVTGTLHNGQFTQTANVTVPAFTAAALTRDTLLLYNLNTGSAAIGTLKAGHLSTMKTVTGLGKYFALAAGSCDSVVLYNSGTGAASVLAVSGGTITHRKSYRLPKHLRYVDASCDTVSFYLPPPSGSTIGTIVLGTLKKGAYAHTSNQNYTSEGLIIAHSSHSYLRYDPFLRIGSWGTSSGGKEPLIGSATFSAFTNVAGTADSVILYMWQSGTAAFAILTGGSYSFVGTATLSAGWQFIVGGK